MVPSQTSEWALAPPGLGSAAATPFPPHLVGGASNPRGRTEVVGSVPTDGG